MTQLFSSPGPSNILLLFKYSSLQFPSTLIIVWGKGYSLEPRKGRIWGTEGEEIQGLLMVESLSHIWTYEYNGKIVGIGSKQTRFKS